MLFDINDFDETLPGPWEWDVKRLAASFEIMGRDRGFSAGRPPRRRHGRGAGSTGTGCGRPPGWVAWTRGTTIWRPGRCSSWSARRSASSGSARARARPFRRWWPRPRTRDSTRVFTKRAAEVDGELRIVADPPLIIPIEDWSSRDREWDDPDAAHQEAAQLLPAHARGPPPSRRGVPLRPRGVQDGRRGQRRNPLLHPVDAGPRPQRPAVPADQGGAGLRARTLPAQEHLPAPRPARRRGTAADAGGDRHLPGLGQRTRASTASPATTTCASSTTGRAAPTSTRMLVPGATLYSRICGATLARAHARWGDRIAIASYLGKGDAFDRAIADFSAAYADQNERDYEAFAAAIELGAGWSHTPACSRGRPAIEAGSSQSPDARDGYTERRLASLGPLPPKGTDHDHPRDPAEALVPVGPRLLSEDAREGPRPARRRGVHGPRGLRGARRQGGGPRQRHPGRQGGRLVGQDPGRPRERRLDASGATATSSTSSRTPGSSSTA